ncbi:citrulline utilization hydrolase CtlX [Cochlodiniinecator piscidefendens]|uniref:citrulline utilization hydrolase CtlX n=1 Tax=Cochlodiniinecator piscidefendens TaxID=2715756 RepID=UPI00140B1122|nr:arginine deiminase-related protein [Cochlodiniinecator piscidefendens]
MQKRSVQAPSAAIMIRPHRFHPNPATQADNAFQTTPDTDGADILAKRAHQEVTQAANALRNLGVRIDLFEDQGDETPDSVFPNNWFSTHHGGHVAVYPMFPENRRGERRMDVIELLKHDFRVQDVIDYSGLEPDGLFLEGTGAMVLDHQDRVAYVIRSNRADPVLLERFCTHFNYEPMVFDAVDRNGTPIYHTNVLMCIATEFVLIGLEMIPDETRASEIKARLAEAGRIVIALSTQQIEKFAGNAIELQGEKGRILALSQTAMDSLTETQIGLIEQSAQLVPLAIPTIEMAGGSVRCMIAGNHLSERN